MEDNIIKPGELTYSQHLFKNLRVAAHALTDVFAHLIHGFIPFIYIEHHSGVDNSKATRG